MNPTYRARLYSVKVHETSELSVEGRNGGVPTTENLGTEVDRRLRESWAKTFAGGGTCLEKVRIWETDRNICEIAR